MNISSIVVQTRPEYLESVLEDIKKCGVCDYHFHDEKGRIIVTIEGEDVSEELEKLRVIEEIPYVIAADMQMSYSEEELERHLRVLDSAEAVPKVLQGDTTKIDPATVVYNGDLKKKDVYEFAKKQKV